MKRKNMSVIIIAVLLMAFVFYSLTFVFHTCDGDNCGICFCLISLSAPFLMIAILARAAQCASFSLTEGKPNHDGMKDKTPVKLRVKLSD